MGCGLLDLSRGVLKIYASRQTASSHCPIPLPGVELVVREVI